MFHRAIELKYLDGTALEVMFQDGIASVLTEENAEQD